MADQLITGVPIVALLPGLIEIAKRAGLPVRFAGLAAIGLAMVLVALVDLANARELAVTIGDLAAWGVAGVIYGLAAAGLYDQRGQFPLRSARRPEAPSLSG